MPPFPWNARFTGPSFLSCGSFASRLQILYRNKIFSIPGLSPSKNVSLTQVTIISYTLISLSSSCSDLTALQPNLCKCSQDIILEIANHSPITWLVLPGSILPLQYLNRVFLKLWWMEQPWALPSWKIQSCIRQLNHKVLQRIIQRQGV